MIQDLASPFSQKLILLNTCFKYFDCLPTFSKNKFKFSKKLEHNLKFIIYIYRYSNYLKNKQFYNLLQQKFLK